MAEQMHLQCHVKLHHVIDPRKFNQRNEIANVIITVRKPIILDKGSFNLPSIDQESRNIKYQYHEKINEPFLILLDVTNAQQIIGYPAIGNNTIDLLSTNRVS